MSKNFSSNLIKFKEELDSMRICCTCKKELSKEMFGKSEYLNRRSPRCKKCKKISDRKYYVKNREKIRLHNKVYLLKNKNKMRIKKAEYTLKNKDKKKQYDSDNLYKFRNRMTLSDFLRKAKLDIKTFSDLRVSRLYASSIKHCIRYKDNEKLFEIRAFQSRLFTELLNRDIDMSYMHNKYKDIDNKI